MKRLPLDIANYQTLDPQNKVSSVINQFVFMRRHKKEFTVQKPQAITTIDDSAWRKQQKIGFYFTDNDETQDKVLLKKVLNDSYKLSHITKKHLQPQSKQKLQPKQQQGISKKEAQSNILAYPKIKTKIIEKLKRQSLDRNRQKQLQRSYKRYLLNYLHKSNLLLIANNIPPTLSVLETIDDGQFLPDGQKKDFPHWSNVLQVTDIPSSNSQCHFQKKIVKIQDHQRIFTIQDNTIFKIKHISKLLDQLFKQSTQYLKKVTLMNNNGDTSLKPDNQNHNFQDIAQKIGVSFRTCKLMYDLLNDHFDLQGQFKLGRPQLDKLQGFKQIKNLLQEQMQKYYRKLKQTDTSFMRHSSYIPMQESYLSLRDLRMIFLQIYEQ